MKFAILRLHKLKTKHSVVASLRHAYRAQTTPNANPELASKNQYAGIATLSDAVARFDDRLATVGRIRKNAVLAIEFLVTASPEIMASLSVAEQNRYFSDALHWLKQQYGAENVIAAGIHRDEITPHMWAQVLPIHQGKLNARHFIGGSKNRLSELQTEFHETVAAKFGMQRGVQGSRARHTQVRQWYTVMRDALQLPLNTTAERIKLLMSGRLTEAVATAAAAAANARQQLERATKTLQRAQERAQQLDIATAEARSVSDRLRRIEALNERYREQISALEADKRAAENLRQLIAPYLPQIQQDLGLVPETNQPEVTQVTIDPNPADQAAPADRAPTLPRP